MHLRLPSTSFVGAVNEIFRRLDSTIPENVRDIVDVFFLGGVAVHIYTQHRVSADLNVVFSRPLAVPDILIMPYTEAGSRKVVRLATGNIGVLTFMHRDWQDDAFEADKIGRIQIKVISPLDLAVSMVSRFTERDRADIQELALVGLLKADALEQRCNEALEYYVGDSTVIRHNINAAVKTVRTCLAGP